MIPMTLFYDESSNEYLQKTAEIKTYLCDQNGNTVRTIGKTQLNIAQYASRQKVGLEVEISGQNKKIQEDVTITLQLIFERQDDDSKSVNTVSQDQFDLKSAQLNKRDKSKNKDQLSRVSKSKDKKNFLFPSTAQSQVTVKSAQQAKMKHSGVTETLMDEKYSQKMDKNRNKKQKSPIKQLQDIRKEIRGMKRNQQQQTSQEDESFFSRFDKLSNKRQVSIKKQVLKKQQDLLKKQQQQQTQFNYYKEDEQTKSGSLEFRFHMATKKITTLERENSKLQKETQRLKQIIEDLIQEKSQKQITQTSINSKIQQQLEQFRKTLIEKEMKINELQGLNKLVVNRQEQKEKENKSLKNQIKELKQKLEHEKNKLAKVLQTAMETQNTELLEIIEKQINDEFY